MDAPLLKRLGAQFLIARVQDKDWNTSQAARHAKMAPGVILRIERGLNVEWASVEKYAVALGHPLEWWLRQLFREEVPKSPATSVAPATGATFHEPAAPAGGIEKRPASGERRR